jgi:sulfoxide reductase heme-binding subunit YedZ
MIDSQALWYLTRGSGAVLLLLLSGVVVLGILGPLRISAPDRWPRFAVGMLHRDLALLALAVLAVHIVTAVLDPFAPIGWVDAIVPLHSAYRPLWLGLGALAFDLILALVITSLVRRRLGYERWRRIHWLAYLCWPVAVLHGLGTGTDARSLWMLALVAVCGAATLGAVAVRVQGAPELSETARTRILAGLVAAPVLTAVFAVLGPLQGDWAKVAGTPSADLGAGQMHPATGSGALESFSAPVEGRMQRSAAPGGRLVDLDLSLSGRFHGVMRVRLAGTPNPGGGLTLVGSQVDLSVPRLGPVMVGTVVALHGGRLRARLEQYGGHSLLVRLRLRIPEPAPRSAAVSGRLIGQPSSA